METYYIGKKPNTNVIKVMNATTASVYRNISLARQWSSLTGMAVVNYLPNPICKFVYSSTFIVNRMNLN